MQSASQITGTRVLKCGISLVAFAGSLAWSCLCRVLGMARRGTCVVLYYHAVPADQRARFARQLDILSRWTKPLAIPEDRKGLRKGARYSAVTFDDGFTDFAEQALPELERRSIPAVVFVIAGALGKIFGSEDYSSGVMTLEALRALPENLVTIGSHTVTHPMLTRIAKEAAEREITTSRSVLESLLNRKITLFSFPFGDFDESLVEVCRNAGYERVFTTLPGYAFAGADEFVVGRVRVDPTDWPLEFRLKLAGAYGWLPRAFAVKRRLASSPLARAIFGRRQPRVGNPSPAMIREPGAS